MSAPPGEGEEFAKWEQSAKDVCVCVCLSSRLYERLFLYHPCQLDLAGRALVCSLSISDLLTYILFLSQQTAENQTSSSSSNSSGGAAAKKSSSSGNSFTSSIKRQGSIGSSTNGGSKVSISDNAGSSTNVASKGSSKSGISSTKGASRNDRRCSVVSTVEEVLMLSSEKELEEEESHSGEVEVPSSTGNASSLDTKLESSLSSSLSQSLSCSDTDGMTSEWPLCVDLWLEVDVLVYGCSSQWFVSLGNKGR